MFETKSITHNNFGKSKVISKNISLGNDLTLFISGACKDHNFIDFLLNKILDYSIDKISLKNTYKDFSNTLENINSVLKTWNSDLEDPEEMNMFIWILNGKDFLFSNIWKSSCYLVKKNNVIEITDKKEKKREFSYISNWELEHWDIITLSNKRLFNFLSESDLIDSYNKDIEKFNSTIQEILNEESYEKNISIISFCYKSKEKSVENKKVNYVKETLLKIADTNFCKRIIAYYLILKEKCNNKSGFSKKIWLSIMVLLLIILLFNITSTTLEKNNKSENIVQSEKILAEAQEALVQAWMNVNNRDIFDLNIELCSKKLKKLQEKKLYLEKTKSLQNKLFLLKKTVNWIETFSENEQNRLIKYKKSDTIKLIWVNKKIYIIWKKSISGPIIKWKKLKTYNFKNIWDDFFIDATPIWNDISLITNKWNVALFKKNGSFSFVDVIGQDKWQEADAIASYLSNIYLVSKEEGQIYMHKKSGSFFTKWTPYILSKDKSSLKWIIDIAIDWGFYILKKDLSFVKFFSKPYRLESLSVNNLPENYNIEDKNAPIKIKTRKDLNYVYMLLNNKIFIFKPSNNNYRNTKSLTYLWQIEWTSNSIKDFYIAHDKEIIILSKTWLYKVNFEVDDGKIIVR